MPIHTFKTRQFRAGNSQAVRLPAEMAFPSKTELTVYREGDRIIIEPTEKSLAQLPSLFAALELVHNGARPEFEEKERNW